MNKPIRQGTSTVMQHQKAPPGKTDPNRPHPTQYMLTPTYNSKHRT